MSQPHLRIAIADDEEIMCEYLQQTLPGLGHEVVAVAHNGRELVETCLATHPDLIITDIKMPVMDGLEAIAALNKETPVPVILVSAFQDQELMNRAEKSSVMAYLIKPIREANLRTTIGIAMSRYEEFQAVWKETDDLRQSLDDRTLIEKAKGILMRKLDMDEPSAFRRLQKTAMSKKKKVVDIARVILAAEEILQADDA